MTHKTMNTINDAPETQEAITNPVLAEILDAEAQVKAARGRLAPLASIYKSIGQLREEGPHQCDVLDRIDDIMEGIVDEFTGDDTDVLELLYPDDKEITAYIKSGRVSNYNSDLIGLSFGDVNVAIEPRNYDNVGRHGDIVSRMNTFMSDLSRARCSTIASLLGRCYQSWEDAQSYPDTDDTDGLYAYGEDDPRFDLLLYPSDIIPMGRDTMDDALAGYVGMYIADMRESLNKTA